MKNDGQDEPTGGQKRDEKPSMVDTPVEKGDEGKKSFSLGVKDKKDVGSKKGDTETEELSHKDTGLMDSSGKKVSESSDVLLEKVDGKKIGSEVSLDAEKYLVIDTDDIFGIIK